MQNGSRITDAESEIIKILWKNGPMTSSKLFDIFDSDFNRNKGTFKTLLTRLVNKGIIKREKLNERHFIYHPVVTEKEYLAKQQHRMINKVFDGSAKNLLLNLVQEEKITQKDLEDMINLINSEEK